MSTLSTSQHFCDFYRKRLVTLFSTQISPVGSRKALKTRNRVLESNCYGWQAAVLSRRLPNSTHLENSKTSRGVWYPISLLGYFARSHDKTSYVILTRSPNARQHHAIVPIGRNKLVMVMFVVRALGPDGEDVWWQGWSDMTKSINYVNGMAQMYLFFIRT